MKKKVYLVVNDKEGLNKYSKVLSFFDKNEIIKMVEDSNEREVFICIQDNNIDEIIGFAKEQKYSIINKGRTIILNKCFQNTGYTIYGENIAHEAINKFVSDDGSRYFFLCDDGKIRSKTILDGTYINSDDKNYCIEKVELLSYSKYESGDKGRYCLTQWVDKLSLVSLENEGKITYKDIPVRKIFKENSFTKKTGFMIVQSSNEEDFPCITFKSEGQCKKPANIGEKLFQYDDPVFTTPLCKMMRQFIIEGTELFKAIEEIIKDSNFVNETPLSFESEFPEENSILSIIGRKERETYLSSLIAYLFQCAPKVVENFINCKLGDYTIYREEKNVDILIRGENKIIIIENKINAAINEGEKKEWYELINSKEKKADLIEEINNLIPDDLKSSQLQKYYKLACYYARLQNLDIQDVQCFLLCPEYKKSHYDVVKEQYAAGVKYTVKSYKNLYEAITEFNLSGLNEFKKEIAHDIKRTIFGFIQNQNTHYMDMVCGRFARKVIFLSEIKEKYKRNFEN